MENPEEIMHSLEEFSKMKPKDIPRELEEYLCFVAKTGDPVYQWSLIKSLFREKMVKVITEFYESCHGVDDIPPCPNVEMFNYDIMKNFILEKLDTFIAAPFTVQRICELLTTPRKEYNRIDKYMRALEKNILVVSTMEPGGRRGTENGEGIVNGIESEHSEHVPEAGSEINVEEMDDSLSWPRNVQSPHISFENKNGETTSQVEVTNNSFESLKIIPCTSSTQETVISCPMYEERLISIEPVSSSSDQSKETKANIEDEKEVTITAVHLQADTAVLSLTPEESMPKVEAETTTENKSNEDNEAPELETPVDTKIEEDKIEEVKESLREVDSGENKSDDNKDDEVSITSESGIENISPETSTSSPENLEVTTSDKSEVVPKSETKSPEKIESDSESLSVKPIIQNEIESSSECTDENISDKPDLPPKSEESEVTTSQNMWQIKDFGLEGVMKEVMKEFLSDSVECPILVNQPKQSETTIKKIEDETLEESEIQTVSCTAADSSSPDVKSEDKIDSATLVPEQVAESTTEQQPQEEPVVMKEPDNPAEPKTTEETPMDVEVSSS